MRTVVALGVIAAATVGLRWNDPFHMAIGAVVMIVLLVIAVTVARQLQDDEETDEGPAERDVARDIILGTLFGAASLGVLWVAFMVAAATPLYGLFYNRDCSKLLESIVVLDEGQAFKRIVELVNERLGHPVGPDCRTQLFDRKVRALLAMAETNGDARPALQAARDAAVAAGLTDLGRVVATRLDAERTRQETAEKEKHLNEQAVAIAAEQEKLAHERSLLEQIQKAKLDGRSTEDGVVIRLPDTILFSLGSADLTAQAGEALKRVAQVLGDGGGTSIALVQGHTDATGDPGANQLLSEQRANAVANFLTTQGVAKKRLLANGFGAQRPCVPENLKDPRNRRVEIVIQG